MHVELSTAMNILAHELRGPLGVIQGYVRLLRQRHTGQDDERMLIAIHEATGRLATLGRQASDLSQWATAGGARPRVGSGTTTVGNLMDELREGVSARGPIVWPAERSAIVNRQVVTHDARALCAALVALVEAGVRDAVGAPVRVECSSTPDTIDVTIAPARPPADATDPSQPVRSTPAFERGGMGLALVLASHVLAAHGARVTESPRAPGGVTVRLRSEVERS